MMLELNKYSETAKRYKNYQKDGVLNSRCMVFSSTQKLISQIMACKCWRIFFTSLLVASQVFPCRLVRTPVSSTFAILLANTKFWLVFETRLNFHTHIIYIQICCSLNNVHCCSIFTWIFFNETYCLASKGFTLDKILETSFTLIRNK